MTMASDMLVTLRLPTRKLHSDRAVRLFAVAEDGAFGILPNHTDFVTALVPSVLSLITSQGEEQFFGIDEGLLVKKGHVVEIAVRRGVRGDDLETLHQKVRENFIEMHEDERAARSALSKLEADMVRRFADLRGPGP